DEGGNGVRGARITLQWEAPPQVSSRSADDAGRAFFPAPDLPTVQPLTARIVNVAATAGTYSWPDDRAQVVHLIPGDAPAIEVSVAPDRAETAIGGAVAFTVSVRNVGARPAQAVVSAPEGPGVTTPAVHHLAVAPGAMAHARLVWEAGDLPPGDYAIPLAVSAGTPGVAKAARSAIARFSVIADSAPELRVVHVGAPDRRYGEGFEVTAEVENLRTDRPATALVNCVLVEARRFLLTQEVHLAPRAKATVRWGPVTGSRALQPGVHTARVSVTDAPGAVGGATFVVK
ncbi:MAG: hypothetical protein FJX74_24080, partial [Armatimonadetes bacterium]|nr:hypothetical protein [Armatimonadota bacterium]